MVEKLLMKVQKQFHRLYLSFLYIFARGCLDYFDNLGIIFVLSN